MPRPTSESEAVGADRPRLAAAAQVASRASSTAGVEGVGGRIERDGDVGLRGGDRVHRHAVAREAGEDVGEEADLAATCRAVSIDTSVMPRRTAIALTCGPVTGPAAETTVPGSVRLVDRADVERDAVAGAAAGWRAGGATSAPRGGDLLRLLVVEGAQQPRRGQERRVGGEQARAPRPRSRSARRRARRRGGRRGVGAVGRERFGGRPPRRRPRAFPRAARRRGAGLRRARSRATAAAARRRSGVERAAAPSLQDDPTRDLRRGRAYGEVRAKVHQAAPAPSTARVRTVLSPAAWTSKPRRSAPGSSAGRASGTSRAAWSTSSSASWRCRRRWGSAARRPAPKGRCGGRPVQPAAPLG